MRNLQQGTLRRINVADESDLSDDDVSLGNLSAEDLGDSEEEQSESENSSEGAIKQDLAEIPFGTLMKAQNHAPQHTGRKDPPKSVRMSENKNDSAQDHDGPKNLKRKRDNKHAPTEVSSKKPVGRSREAIEVQKIERRDPRFDPDMTTKSTNTAHINKNYGFLEDYKKDEMRILKEKIKKENNPDAKAKLEKTLGSMQSREQASKERERRARVLSEFKQKERSAAKDGKIPYHLKAADKNKLYLKDKFDSMKDSKALDKFLEKKRKRRSQKDRKRALPT